MSEPAPAPTPPAKSPALIVFGAIAIVGVVIGTCGAYYLWPRGDRIGTIDLREGSPTLDVDVGAGDKVSFRFERITVGTNGSYPNSSRSRTNQVHDELRASRIVITAARSGGTESLTTDCGAFAGKASTGSNDTDSVTTSGVPLDCALMIEKAGPYKLSAKVTWAPKDVREAIVEVRREAASK